MNITELKQFLEEVELRDNKLINELYYKYGSTISNKKED